MMSHHTRASQKSLSYHDYYYYYYYDYRLFVADASNDDADVAVDNVDSRDMYMFHHELQ